MKKQPAGLLEKLLKNREDESVFVERHIDIDVHDLEPNPRNFYSMSNIERLKNLIKTTGKVEELTVKPIGKGKYMVAAGHRRRRAVLELISDGEKISHKVPCSVVSFKAVGNKSAEDMELLWLSSSNLGQREYRTMAEKIMEVETIGRLLRKDYDVDYAGGLVTGPFRCYLAKFLCMTESRLQRLMAMKNVIPMYLEMVDDGVMKETAAYELTNLTGKEQKKLMDAMQGQEITVKGIKQKKEELFATPMEEKTGETAVPVQCTENVEICALEADDIGSAAEENGMESTTDEIVTEQESQHVPKSSQIKAISDTNAEMTIRRTSEKSQLMTSVDMLMSYCEGRHDASNRPCQGCVMGEGENECRMGTKPCMWHIESTSRKRMFSK